MLMWVVTSYKHKSPTHFWKHSHCPFGRIPSRVSFCFVCVFLCLHPIIKRIVEMIPTLLVNKSCMDDKSMVGSLAMLREVVDIKQQYCTNIA